MAGSNKAEVQIGAKIDEATAAVNALGAQFSEFSSRTIKQFEAVNAVTASMGERLSGISAHADKAGGGMRRLSNEAGSTADGVGGHMRAMVQVSGEQLEHLNLRLRDTGALFSKFGELFLVGLGVERLKSMVEHTVEVADALDKMEKKTGQTAERLQGLQFGAKMADVSTESLDRSLRRLALAMTEAQQESPQIMAAFESVGISAKDLKSLSLDEVLQRIADKFKDTEDGAAKLAIAQQLLGRTGGELIPYLDGGSEAMDRFAARARVLGDVLSKDQVAALAQVDDSLKESSAAWDGFKNQIAVSLAPILKAVSDAFVEVVVSMNGTGEGMSTLGTVLRGLVGGFVGFFTAVTNGFRVVWEIAKATILQTNALLTTLGEILIDLATGKITAAKEAWSRYAKNSVDIWSNAMDKIVDSSRTAQDTLVKIFTPIEPKAEPGKEGEGKKGKLEVISTQTRLAEWKSELDRIRDAQGNFNELSKEDEVRFWESKLSLARKGSKEYEGVFHEIVTAKRAAAAEEMATAIATLDGEIQKARNNHAEQAQIMKAEVDLVKAAYGERSRQYAEVIRKQEVLAQQWAAYEERIAIDGVKAREKIYAGEIDEERAALASRLKLRQVSNAQVIAEEAALEDRLYTIHKSALEEEMAIAARNPNADPKLIAQINAQIEALEAEHERKLSDLHRKTVEEASKYQIQAERGIQDSFQTFVEDIGSRTKTLSQAFRDLLGSIEAVITKMAASQFAESMFGGGSKGGSIIGDIIGGLFGGTPKDTGGFVMPGQSYFVGVPEIFTPSTSGYMTPVSQMKGDVTVTNHFNIQGPISKQTQMQMAAAAGKSIQNAVARNT